MMKPTSFVQVGTGITTRALGSDGFGVWSAGVVQDVEARAEDARGAFVQCTVLSFDGALSDNVKLYDDDFDHPDAAGSWKFQGPMTSIITTLVRHDRDLEALREDILRDDDDEDEVDDENDDGDGEGDETDDEERERQAAEDKAAENVVNRGLGILKSAFFPFAAIALAMAMLTNRHVFHDGHHRGQHPRECCIQLPGFRLG